MSQKFPTLQTPIPEPNTANQVDTVNLSLVLLDAAFISAIAKNRSTATPPGSPGDEAYIVGPSATGDWAGKENYFTIFRNGWLFQAPVEGWSIWLDDEGYRVRYDGSSWVEDVELGSVTTGITAATTQTQGEGALTATVNQVSTVGTTSDVVTLPTARVGAQCIVANDGANSLQIFPASGAAIDAGATDASISLAAAARVTLVALSATAWIKT